MGSIQHPPIKHKNALARAIVESLHNSFAYRDLRLNGPECLVDDFYLEGSDGEYSGKSVAAPARSIVDKLGFFNQFVICDFDRRRTGRDLRPVLSALISTVLAKNIRQRLCAIGEPRSQRMAKPRIGTALFEELGLILKD